MGTPLFPRRRTSPFSSKWLRVNRTTSGLNNAAREKSLPRGSFTGVKVIGLVCLDYICHRREAMGGCKGGLNRDVQVDPALLQGGSYVVTCVVPEFRHREPRNAIPVAVDIVRSRTSHRKPIDRGCLVARREHVQAAGTIHMLAV